MNHATSESNAMNSSSVALENMKTELNNMIHAMIELAWEGIDLVEQIKENLRMNESISPAPPHKFDPFRTIGKY